MVLNWRNNVYFEAGKIEVHDIVIKFSFHPQQRKTETEIKMINKSILI